jgi:hypothetical protein
MEKQKWPRALKTAKQAGNRFGVSAERLTELAKAGFAPHYRIDGGEPLFEPSELKRWLAENLTVTECKGLPTQIVVVNSGAAVDVAPEEIRHVAGLCDISHVLAPGIYFLCKDNRVVYVGQSVSPGSRVLSHRNDSRKPFDAVYFLSWPEWDLDRIETAFIKHLKPIHNKTPGAVARMTETEGAKAIRWVMRNPANDAAPDVAAP